MTDQEINTRVALRLGWGSEKSTPDYCHSIEAAWEPVEKMQSLGLDVEITACANSGTHVAVKKEIDAPAGYCDYQLLANESAKDAPMAICKAFLKLQ